MELRFNIGDRVRVLKDFFAKLKSGTEVTVVERNESGYLVVKDGSPERYAMLDDELELVVPKLTVQDSFIPSIGTVSININSRPVGTEGTKHDAGKPDLSLLSLLALQEISKAFMFGEKKYGRYNYLGGMEWMRVAGALLRHVYKWIWGEDRDAESGLHHLAHAGACVIILLDYVLRNIGTDNRYKPEINKGA